MRDAIHCQVATTRLANLSTRSVGSLRYWTAKDAPSDFADLTIPVLLSCSSALVRRRKANGIATQVIDGVVLSEEGVTDNPKGTNGCGDVHSGERRDAGAAGVEDIVLTLEGVLLATKGERHVRQRGDSVAVDGVLAVPRLGGTDPADQTRLTLILMQLTLC